MAHRAAGLASATHMVAGKLSAEWRAYREKLAHARYVARANLHALTPSSQDEARALIAYYAARAERADSTGATRSARRRLREVFARSGAVQPGAPLPALLAARGNPQTTDPVFAAITAAKAADRVFTASLRGLDENDPVRMARANALSDASSDAMKALGETRPTTQAGLLALIRHYADDAQLNEPYSVGAHSLLCLARQVSPLPRPDS
ncbi:hypothetical protein [Methylobacterium goesingense]|uniref:Integrase n=1 Tax=Methylobacterium goesingense TaxID=243690 RepID=A0ABV2LBZ5_9HYPH|nr:hypothetical protein [Methylobacterium goesingense]